MVNSSEGKHTTGEENTSVLLFAIQPAYSRASALPTNSARE